MRHIAGAGVRIFIHNRLKLFLGCVGALLGGGERRKIWLRWSAHGPQLRILGAHRLRQFQAGLFILRAQVVPSPNHGGQHDDDHNCRGNHLGPVLDGPMRRILRGSNGHTAECVLLKLMAGLCAHKLPF